MTDGRRTDAPVLIRPTRITRPEVAATNQVPSAQACALGARIGAPLSGCAAVGSSASAPARNDHSKPTAQRRFQLAPLTSALNS
jgi:hypothetical protein